VELVERESHQTRRYFLLHRRDYMSIEVHRDADLGVSEDSHNQPRVHALGE
jgi:hypothetical protein